MGFSGTNYYRISQWSTATRTWWQAKCPYLCRGSGSRPSGLICWSGSRDQTGLQPPSCMVASKPPGPPFPAAGRPFSAVGRPAPEATAQPSPADHGIHWPVTALAAPLDGAAAIPPPFFAVGCSVPEAAALSPAPALVAVCLGGQAAGPGGVDATEAGLHHSVTLQKLQSPVQLL